MTFERGDVVYVSEDATHTTYYRVAGSIPSRNLRGGLAVVLAPEDSDGDAYLETADGYSCASARFLTLVGGPRMKFAVGDLVDVAKDAFTSTFPSKAAGTRVKVTNAAPWCLPAIGEVPVESLNDDGEPTGAVNLPLAKYLTLVKREGYIDRTVTPVVVGDNDDDPSAQDAQESGPLWQEVFGKSLADIEEQEEQEATWAQPEPEPLACVVQTILSPNVLDGASWACWCIETTDSLLAMDGEGRVFRLRIEELTA